MSRIDKLMCRLQCRPKDFTWDEAVRLLEHHGFQQVKKTGTGRGSHRKFRRPDGLYFQISQPHPENTLKIYQVDDLLEVLQEVGRIDE
jgi:predicted RNA binding protein YcfA (HicA-like mRNA interferase family)